MGVKHVVVGSIFIDEDDCAFSYVRSQGPGGQHVNNTSSAVVLRYDVKASSLPDSIKIRILAQQDYRITKDGMIVIKSQTSRSQFYNQEEAINRLADYIRQFSTPQKKRHPTKPTRSSQRKRVDKKVQRGKTKQMRNKVDY